MAKEVQDFGQKIGGARKDFYRAALNINDMNQMNDAEKLKYVKRDNIWKREDPKKMIEQGISRTVAYWRNEMRLCIHPTPLSHTENYLERYIRITTDMKDMVSTVKTEEDVKKFYETYFAPKYLITDTYYKTLIPEAKGIFTENIFSTAKMSLRVKNRSEFYGMTESEKKEYLLRKNLLIAEFGKEVTLTSYIDKQCLEYKYPGGRGYFYESSKCSFADAAKAGTFLILDLDSHRIAASGFPDRISAEKVKEEFIRTSLDQIPVKKQIQKGKKQFPIPQIACVKRVGPECDSENITGEDFVKEFGIRGGEFGLWMSDADAAGSLSRCYEAFHDLARTLDIDQTDISFRGRLSIGFGSRGHSAAAAHYEPERQVINLTKYRGQGVLCHEWGHALDDMIGRTFGQTAFTKTKFPFASEYPKNRHIPLVFKELMEAMRYKTVECDTAKIKADILKEISFCKKYYLLSLSTFRPEDVSEEDLKKWDDLVEEGWTRKEEAKQGFDKFFSHCVEYSHPVIEQLSEMRKQLCKKVILKDVRNRIIQQMITARDLEQRLLTMPETKMMQIETDFYLGSQKFDTVFTKQGHGYWSSAPEMFARAFDCYISDKLKEKGEQNDYLTYGADAFVFALDDTRYAAVPEGEEKRIINQKFDELFDYLKAEKFFKNN